MALLKSKISSLLMPVIALTVLLGCSERGDYAAGSRNEAASAYTSSAYWVVDRIECADTDGIAVLENPKTLQTEVRSVKGLPMGVEEGQVLTGGGTLWIDNEETSARAASILERFKRLKAD